MDQLKYVRYTKHQLRIQSLLSEDSSPTDLSHWYMEKINILYHATNLLADAKLVRKKGEVLEHSAYA